MTHSFNPNPIAEAARMMVLAILLTIFVVIFRGSIGAMFNFILMVIWAVAIIKILYAYAIANFHTVTLDKTTVTYTQGVFAQKKTILPYERITEASFDQTVIQRLFNVGDLKVDSAGGKSIAIHVANVRKGEIDKILDKINQEKGA